MVVEEGEVSWNHTFLVVPVFTPSLLLFFKNHLGLTLWKKKNNKTGCEISWSWNWQIIYLWLGLHVPCLLPTILEALRRGTVGDSPPSSFSLTLSWLLTWASVSSASLPSSLFCWELYWRLERQTFQVSLQQALDSTAKKKIGLERVWNRWTDIPNKEKYDYLDTESLIQDVRRRCHKLINLNWTCYDSVQILHFSHSSFKHHIVRDMIVV